MHQSAIWQEVRAWPRGERLALATQLLQSLQQDEVELMTEERRAAILSLIGAWKSDQAIDEKQILDEERMKKYG